MSYREEKLAHAMSGAQQIADEPYTDSVYLAGSLTAHLGSPTSDVDVFVLTGKADVDDRPAQQKRYGDLRLNIESYSIEWIDAALEKLSLWHSTRQNVRHNALSRAELDVL